MGDNNLVVKLENVGNQDVGLVGGKNASLGEMLSSLIEKGIKVPAGFATISHAYWELLDHNNIRSAISSKLRELEDKKISLPQAGAGIRELFLKAEYPPRLKHEIFKAYEQLCQHFGRELVDVAVRSSATAEDLPEASFAGQQETYLNISGKDELLKACLQCYASLFTDRAIVYRQQRGIDHMAVALSIGIQKMVRSDLAGAGVVFTLDTETGFPKVILINAAWGLGEFVVKGMVSPDQYMTYKPLLNTRFKPLLEKELGTKARKLVYDSEGGKTTKMLPTSDDERNNFVLSEEEIFKLSRWACVIEEHYGRAMDIEWAKDGKNGELYIVQARPETAHSQVKGGVYTRYKLKEKKTPIVKGLSVGSSIASGEVCVMKDAKNLEKFPEGHVLVAQMTDPDWGPIMKKAKAIVTDEGGRTCHAAIVGRELGIPVVVGSGNATTQLKTGMKVTISCAEGEVGKVYEGELSYESQKIDLNTLPKIKTKIMINAADPSCVFKWWQLPVKGIGLARMEFVITSLIKVHPMALVRWPNLKKQQDKDAIEELTKSYENKKDYFVDKLSRALAKMAASRWPDPVVVRFSDFKTNEYAQLIGGEEFEFEESNPMLGFRGASRYYSEHYREGFALECLALKKAREEMGFENIIAMIPFCRTVEEGKQVLATMESFGLKRGDAGLRVYVMAEIPSNILLADEFSEIFDGFSIGSNDLTQLTLGIDRDSSELAYLFDERNDAVKRSILSLLYTAHAKGIPVGICGEGPSNYPDFAEFLVRGGISSLSLSPDSVFGTIENISKIETETGDRGAEFQAPFH